MAILLREAIGDRLRHARTTQRRTLREISRTARVSLGYLSEVERGQKEASSELLAAICDALELPLSDLLHHVAADLGAVQRVTGEMDRVDEVGRVEGAGAVGAVDDITGIPGAHGEFGGVPGGRLEQRADRGSHAQGSATAGRGGQGLAGVQVPSATLNRFGTRLDAPGRVIVAA